MATVPDCGNYPAAFENLRVGGGYVEDTSGFSADALGNGAFAGDVTIDGELSCASLNMVAWTGDPIPISAGGTGANTAEEARINLEIISSVNVSAPITGTGTAIDPLVIAAASADNDGYLTKEDWAAFNDALADVDWTAPGTIGSTTANTGKFTTLEATSTLKVGGKAQFADYGTYDLPSIYLGADPTTGIWGGEDYLAMSVGGVTKFFLSTAFAIFYDQIHIGAGDATYPGICFDLDADTGFYRVSSNVLGITTHGVHRGQFTDTGLVMIGTIAGSNLSGTNTGDETASSIKSTLGAASAINDGYLTAANWSTFNGKLDSVNWAAPGSIGSTTPGTGKFTTLEAQTSIKLGATTITGWSDITADWASPGTIGSTTPNTGKFTTVSVGIGTEGLPGLFFGTNADTGLFSSGGDDVYITCGADTAALFAATHVTIAGDHQLRVVTGSEGTPNISLSTDLDTGFYYIGSGSWGYTANATKIVTFSATGIAVVGTVTGTGLSGSNTGDETTSTIKTKLGQAATGSDGWLSSTDWNVFYNKQPAGSYLTSSSWASPGTIGSTTANTGAFTTLSTSGLFTAGTLVKVTGLGSESLPSIYFGANVDTGFFTSGGDDVYITCGAATAALFDATTVVVSTGHQFRIITSSEETPGICFSTDVDTGLYRIGSNNLGVSCGGTKVLDIGTTGLGVTGKLTVGADTNAYNILGRTRIGYSGFDDYAHFSHYDKTGAGDYALAQGADGATYLNASSTKTISIRNNNTEVASVDSTGFLSGTHHAFTFPVSGALTTGSNKVGVVLIIPFACSIVKCYANVGTCPTGADIRYDIHYDSDGGQDNAGTSIFPSPYYGTITATQYLSNTSTFSTTPLPIVAGGTLRLDIDQVGSTIAGSNLTVTLVVKKTGTY